MVKLIKGIELQDKMLEILDDGLIRVVCDKPKRFEPVYGKEYFFIDNKGAIYRYSWIDDRIDNYRFKNYKLFNTEEECEKYQNYSKRRNELSKEFEYKKDNWCFYCDFELKEIEISCATRCLNQGTSYFRREEDIESLIREFGEGYILAWEFNVYI